MGFRFDEGSSSSISDNFSELNNPYRTTPQSKNFFDPTRIQQGVNNFTFPSSILLAISLRLRGRRDKIISFKYILTGS
jgi:hypothetical protein